MTNNNKTAEQNEKNENDTGKKEDYLHKCVTMYEKDVWNNSSYREHVVIN